MGGGFIALTGSRQGRVGDTILCDRRGERGRRRRRTVRIRAGRHRENHADEHHKAFAHTNMTIGSW